METNILNKPIVLSLNKAWQVIGQRTVEQAFTALNGGRSGLSPALGVDISYPKNEDGTWDFDHPEYFNPVSWDDWIKLPIRDFDFVVTTPRYQIRVPTVVISTVYDKMPRRNKTLSRETIFERDGGIDQYTGERVEFHEGNLDHVIPRDLGGKTTFDNIVWTRISTNSAKGNKLPHQVGLKLRRKPMAPPPLPACAAITHARHRDWKHFLKHLER
jgi:5-methylcytosine-specific restriction endonuclease McrA